MSPSGISLPLTSALTPSIVSNERLSTLLFGKWIDRIDTEFGEYLLEACMYIQRVAFGVGDCC